MSVKEVPITIQEEIKTKAHEIFAKIKDANPSADEVNDFICFIDCEIKKFFYNDYAGNTIKELFQIANGEDAVSVTAIDFEFAFHQYEEYLRGMAEYIEEGISAGKITKESNPSLENIIEKDHEFILSIFGNEGANNAAKKMSMTDALYCLNLLIVLPDSLHGYMKKLSGTYFDRLVLTSITLVASVSACEMMDQVNRIVGQVNRVNDTPVSPIRYSVF